MQPLKIGLALAALRIYMDAARRRQEEQLRDGVIESEE